MLTYQDVMTTDYGRLLTAADKWQSMAEELRKVEERYRDSVQNIHTSGNWGRGERGDRPHELCRDAV
ncbi:hypothetical protein ACFZBM_32900 [Streptomyces lavendulae]